MLVKMREKATLHQYGSESLHVLSNVCSVTFFMHELFSSFSEMYIYKGNFYLNSGSH